MELLVGVGGVGGGGGGVLSSEEEGLSYQPETRATT